MAGFEDFRKSLVSQLQTYATSSGTLPEGRRSISASMSGVFASSSLAASASSGSSVSPISSPPDSPSPRFDVEESTSSSETMRTPSPLRVSPAKLGVFQSSALKGFKCDLASQMITTIPSLGANPLDLLEYLFSQLRTIDSVRSENYRSHNRGQFEHLLISQIEQLIPLCQQSACEEIHHLLKAAILILTSTGANLSQQGALKQRWNTLLDYFENHTLQAGDVDFYLRIQQGVFGVQGLSDEASLRFFATHCKSVGAFEALMAPFLPQGNFSRMVQISHACSEYLSGPQEALPSLRR